MSEDRRNSEYPPVDIPFFRPGDRVEKRRGYQYPGVVLVGFQSLDGCPRYVVEADHEDFRGMLHIFSPEQLIKRE